MTVEGGGWGWGMGISWKVATGVIGQVGKRKKTKEPNRSQRWRRGRGENCTRRRQELGMGGERGKGDDCGEKREVAENAVKLQVCPSETTQSLF